LIENVTIFPKEEKAALSALIYRLDLQLIPKGEYVIQEGEMADSMYFILRGKVSVIKDDVVLATLEQGSNFGEMALAERKPSIRTASALCLTPVSVGSLSITDFNIICESYPVFESKIEEEAIKRK
jgi:CRP-like cAMP-binding protein